MLIKFGTMLLHGYKNMLIRINWSRLKIWDYDRDHIFVESWVNFAKSWDIYLMELEPILSGDNVK